MNMMRAIAAVGGLTMVSRITGFLRDVLIANLLGAGPIADAFFVAFKLPNFFRRLTGEGALTVAFVPLFAGHLERGGLTAARAFASDVWAVLVAVLIALTLAAQLAMPWLVEIMAPGFVETAQRFNLTVELTRITFIYLPLISLVALMGGMLNALGRFAVMAAAPILLNLILIAALAAAMVGLGAPALLLAWGVAGAGLAQFIWLLWACQKAGMVVTLRWPRLSPEVRKLLILMAPAALGAGVIHVNQVIDVILASTLPTGSVSFLYYADRINQLPLGVIGVAIGTALLPMLSRQLKRGETANALDTQNRALEFGLLVTVPAATALHLIAAPVIEVLFQRGAFTPAMTAATSAALSIFALGLPAFVMIKIFQPGFFARLDTKTPVWIAAAAVGLNLAAALALMPSLQHIGIAAAAVISSWFNAAALGIFLYRRDALQIDHRLLCRLPRIAVAAAGMGLTLHFLSDALAWFGLPVTTLRSTAGLAAVVVIGMASYGLLAWLLGAFRWHELRAALRQSPKPVTDNSS
jgi:putative peptidoglycan lipid II flippase